MINGWMHICLMNDGYEIACELHGRLLQSGLYDATDTINVSIVGDPSLKIRLVEYILSRWSKYKVHFHATAIEHYEWPALMHMANNAKGSCWYIHTKGASNDARPDVPEAIQQNIRTWRDLMCYHTIGRWQEAEFLLKEGWDALGPLYSIGDGGNTEPHFAGNFWWASDTHVRKLNKNPDLSNRNKAETWVTQVPGMFYDLYSNTNKDYYGFNSSSPFNFYKKSNTNL